VPVPVGPGAAGNLKGVHGKVVQTRGKIMENPWEIPIFMIEHGGL